MTKSETPDLLLISLLKKRKLEVNQYNAGWGYGWGWMEPYLGRTYTT
jgi:hypothetical protein